MHRLIPLIFTLFSASALAAPPVVVWLEPELPEDAVQRKIERLLELGAPPGATTRYPWADADWAQRWPTEEAWVVRLQGGT